MYHCICGHSFLKEIHYKNHLKRYNCKRFICSGLLAFQCDCGEYFKKEKYYKEHLTNCSYDNTLTKYTIYGERCSGTNYLENIINANFDVNLTWNYGWKHFFGFQDSALKNSDDTLFICIVRNLPDWINSFYREKHHLPLKYKNISEKQKLDEFLNKEFWSFNDWDKKELMEDRNIYTGERYKNIFELRHTKIKWMLEDLPNKVKNYIFIRYEDLINDFDNTLLKIKTKGLKVKRDVNFPININYYKKNKGDKFKKKKNKIPEKLILNNSNLIPIYEAKLYNI